MRLKEKAHNNINSLDIILLGKLLLKLTQQTVIQLNKMALFTGFPASVAKYVYICYR